MRNEPRRRWSTRALLTAALAAGVCGFWAASTLPRAAAAPGRADPGDVVAQLGRVLAIVEGEYVEPVDRRRLLEGSIKGLVEGLDPHSSYLTAADYALFRSDTEGRFGGIGVEVDFGREQLTVVGVVEDTPAARAGLAAGDRIVAIDGVDVAGRTPSALLAVMRGNTGTKVRLTVERDGLQQPRELTLTREEIHVKSVTVQRLDGDVLYVRVHQFQDGTRDELVAAVATERRTSGRPAAGVLFDLRHNPGGLVDEAAAVADELLDEGVIYTTRRRGRVIDEVRASAGGALARGAVVTLVDGYTASAAELVAGALQDQKRATIVGSTTYGKGSVQSLLDLPGGAGLRLTTLLYFTPGGHAIQAHGVTPNLNVDSTPRLPAARTPREADLPDHLPNPAGPAPEEPKPPLAGAAPSKRLPTDPRRAADPVLLAGWQLLTGVLPR